MLHQRAACVALALAMAACSAATDESSATDVEAIASTGAIRIRGAIANAVVAEPDRLVFPGDAPIASVANGAILVGDRGDSAVAGALERNPLGFVRRVRAVARQGGAIVVTTDPATLVDALPDADGALDEGAIVEALTAHASQPFTRAFPSRTIAVAPNVQLRLSSGSVTLTPAFTSDLRVRRRGVETLSFVITGDLDATLRLEADLGGAASRHVELPLATGRIPLPPQTIGPLVVAETVHVDVTLACDLSADARASVAAGVTLHDHVAAGITFDARGWTKDAAFDAPTLTPIAPAVSGAGSARVACSLTPRATLLFYDAVGPYVSFATDLAGSVAVAASDAVGSPPDASGTWTVEGGLVVTAGLAGGITIPGLPSLTSAIDARLGKTSFTLYDHRVVLARGALGG